MANGNDDDGGLKRYIAPAIGILLLVAIGWFLFSAATGTRGERKSAPEDMKAVLLPPPPPPPPPPPQEVPPEPETVKEDVPQDTPPEPTPDAPAAVAIDAAGEAGSDAFGIRAGAGGGMGAPSTFGTSTGPATAPSVSDGFYGRYLSGALQDVIQDSDRINRQVFTADVNIWIDPSGKVTRAEIIRSSNDSNRDKMIIGLLQEVRGLDTPPTSIRFPQRITIRGRKSL
jgi:periplasmic protein TonB